MKETKSGVMWDCTIFGESMDFPEKATVLLPENGRSYFREKGLCLEDVEIALWKQGDKALATTRDFVIYFKETQKWVVCEIDQNKKGEGFFIKITFSWQEDCLQELLEAKDNCPVLII